MLSWGASTMGLGGVYSFGAVTAVRLLLGLFEAGLFPGLVYYLTFWYRTEEKLIRVRPDHGFCHSCRSFW